MVSTPGTVLYPTALDDADSLIRAANNAASTLAAPLLAADTTATLTSVAAFPASGSVSLSGGEILYYTGKGATTLTGLVRAREGTTAVASLAAGTRVELRATARHHTVLADAIIATQTKLGGGASSPVDGMFLTGNGAGTSAWATPTAAMISDFGAATDARLAGYAAKASPVVADKLYGLDSADSSQKSFTLSTILNLTRMGVFVDDPAYGAVGDGTTDDTLAIRAAITAAGTNGTLVFKPGKTYLLSGNLTPLQGQTWWGYGATLKRRAAISSATSTNIATGAGSTAITVADASSFRVGMDVTVYNGASYDPTNHRILTIVGNIVTVGTAFTVAFASGGTLITATTQISASAVADVTILGFEIDGNQTNNSALQKWDVSAEIYLSSDRGVVRDCYVHDAQSEGIEVGGVSVLVENCYVLNCQGNGIHLTGSTHGKVRGCYVKNCNLAGTGPGHADGCIVASNSVADTVITGNYVENGIAGIGSWDSDDDSSLICTGNVIRNCTSYPFEGITPNGSVVGNVLFADNLIYSSGTFTLHNVGSVVADAGPYRVIVSGNLFDSTLVSIRQCYGVNFANNIVYGASATTGLLLLVQDCIGVSIHDNTVRRGQYGIYVDGTGGRDVSIQGNHCKEQYTTGIRFNDAGAGTGYSVRGNTVVASASVSASYSGIIAKNNVTVDGNTLDVQAGTAGAIVCPNGGTNTNGAFVTNNTIRSVSGQPSIKAAGGSQNNIITGNLIQQATSIGGGGAQPNTVSGNVTIF